MSIKEQVVELINRNKGDVNDTIETINQMLSIYVILNTIYNYEQICLDLLTLKKELQMELQKYNKKRLK